MNIRELAEAAGVSPATVSLVLNEKPGVGEETRARVMKLAIRLRMTAGRRGIP